MIKRVIKFVERIMLVPIILLLLLFIRLCYLDVNYSEQNGSYFLPINYRGYAVLVYDEPNGSHCDFNDGDRWCKIPSNGLIIIKEDKPCLFGSRLYYPAMPRYSNPNQFPTYKGNVYIHGERISKGKINDLSFKYESFFVGTKAEYDSLAHISPIDALNRDTIYHYLKKVRTSK
jgi:hypothetical protein